MHARADDTPATKPVSSPKLEPNHSLKVEKKKPPKDKSSLSQSKSKPKETWREFTDNEKDPTAEKRAKMLGIRVNTDGTIIRTDGTPKKPAGFYLVLQVQQNALTDPQTSNPKNTYIFPGMKSGHPWYYGRAFDTQKDRLTGAGECLVDDKGIIVSWSPHSGNYGEILYTDKTPQQIDEMEVFPVKHMEYKRWETMRNGLSDIVKDNGSLQDNKTFSDIQMRMQTIETKPTPTETSDLPKNLEETRSTQSADVLIKITPELAADVKTTTEAPSTPTVVETLVKPSSSPLHTLVVKPANTTLTIHIEATSSQQVSLVTTPSASPNMHPLQFADVTDDRDEDSKGMSDTDFQNLLRNTDLKVELPGAQAQLRDKWDKKHLLHPGLLKEPIVPRHSESKSTSSLFVYHALSPTSFSPLSPSTSSPTARRLMVLTQSPSGITPPQQQWENRKPARSPKTSLASQLSPTDRKATLPTASSSVPAVSVETSLPLLTSRPKSVQTGAPRSPGFYSKDLWGKDSPPKAKAAKTPIPGSPQATTTSVASNISTSFLPNILSGRKP